jgi:hypothetical protein
MMATSLVQHQWEFLRDVAKLIWFCEQKGYVVTGGELWRSPEQQTIYFKEGKSKTMASNHLRRLAIDLNFFIDGKPITVVSEIEDAGNYWESLSPLNRWGGHFKTFKDGPHFERNVVQ